MKINSAQCLLICATLTSLGIFISLYGHFLPLSPEEAFPMALKWAGINLSICSTIVAFKVEW